MLPPRFVVIALISVAGAWTVVGRGQTQVHAQAQAAASAPPSFADPQLLARANSRLVAVAARLSDRATLAELLRAALTTPTPASSSLVDDHRSLFLVSAFYVNNWPIAALVPEARSWPQPARRSISLGGRRDHAQHFVVSAAIAGAAGSPLAMAMGLYKEMRDAQGGSGFSFSDLAADRAGTLFGHLATASSQSATRFRDRIAAGVEDRDLMPEISGLPDGLSQAVFKERYGGIGGAGYNEMVADIDRRVAALAFYAQ